jgi:hypothetical protein
MITVKTRHRFLQRPAVRWTGSVLAAGVLLTLGMQAARADTVATSSPGAPDSSAADVVVTASSSTAAAPTSTATTAAPSNPAAPLRARSSVSTQADPSATDPSATDPSSPGDCPTKVTITSVTIDKNLDGSGNVVVNIEHDGQNCPDAKPTTLHIHQNLGKTPTAGSDSVQSNVNYSVGPTFGNSVTFALLSAVEGKCFVQVDASADGIRRGKFFPTGTCPSESIVPSSSAVIPPPVIHSSAEAASSSLPSVTPTVSKTPAPQLAFTGASTAGPVGAAGLLIGSGAWLMAAGRRRTRRH